MDCVALFSGGMDSTTLVYHLLNEGHDPHLLSIDYGQRHRKELQYAADTASRTGLKHDIVDLSGITKLIAASALTFGQDVPDGHYAEDTMKQTVVPNRNMMMLSIAIGVAISEEAEFVAAAMHAGDHFIYPDCRPEFIDAIRVTALIANEGFGDVQIRTPFIYSSKADIARIGNLLEVPWEWTWSCYKGGAIHCGRCGTCVERQEAIAIAGVKDVTIYEDSEYWKKATQNV